MTLSANHETNTPSALRRIVSRGAAALTQPLVPGDFLDYIAPLRAGASLAAKVVAKHTAARGAVSLTLKPGADWRGHVAGQYIRIGVDVDGVRHWRCYSLTCAPGSRELSITVKVDPDGLVSKHLADVTSVGDLLYLEEADGVFTAEAARSETPDAPFAFVVAGSGATPVAGILATHAHTGFIAGAGGEVPVVVQSMRTREDTLFDTEFAALHNAGHIRLIRVYTADEPRLTPARLADLIPDHAGRHIMACGPGELLDALVDANTAGEFGQAITVEHFRLTPTVVGEGGEATFAESGRTLEADGATPLLDVAEAEGIDMPHGCRMGVCFTCACSLKSGSVRDLRNGEVTTVADGEETTIQPCVVAAAGPCTIDR